MNLQELEDRSKEEILLKVWMMRLSGLMRTLIMSVQGVCVVRNKISMT